MKEIILNKAKLKDDEITDVLEKSRAVIRNNDNEIILTRFNRVYFLPGGKLEPGEKPVDTVKREVKEETNIDILLDDIEPFCVVKNYLRDYKLNDGSVVNRLVITYYFSGFTSNDDIEYYHNTEEEKEDKLRGFFIDLDEAFELVGDYNKDNPKATYLAKETLEVLNEYKLINDERS